jgi:hypothetical protein
MAGERQRLLECALESLQNKRLEIEREIAQLTRDLHGGRRSKAGAPAPFAATVRETYSRSRKRASFSKEERFRRAQRMKDYWDKWRKQKSQQ